MESSTSYQAHRETVECPNIFVVLLLGSTRTWQPPRTQVSGRDHFGVLFCISVHLLCSVSPTWRKGGNEFSAFCSVCSKAVLVPQSSDVEQRRKTVLSNHWARSDFPEESDPPLLAASGDVPIHSCAKVFFLQWDTKYLFPTWTQITSIFVYDFLRRIMRFVAVRRPWV